MGDAVDRMRELRSRASRQGGDGDRMKADAAHDTPHYLGKVYSGGSIPTSGERWFLTRPATLAGDEVEGSAGTLAVDGGVSVPVLVLGSAAVAGDYLIADRVDGRWVAEKRGVSPYSTVNGCCAGFGGMSTAPITLVMTWVLSDPVTGAGSTATTTDILNWNGTTWVGSWQLRPANDTLFLADRDPDNPFPCPYYFASGCVPALTFSDHAGPPAIGSTCFNRGNRGASEGSPLITARCQPYSYRWVLGGAISSGVATQ